jgi:hypothetical protein
MARDDEAPAFCLFGLCAKLEAFAAGEWPVPDERVSYAPPENTRALVARRPAAGLYPGGVSWPVQFTMFLQALT